MIVYDIHIRVASAYDDIKDILMHDDFAKAVRDYILNQYPDCVEKTDFAVELPDCEIVFNSTTNNKENTNERERT